MTLKDKDRVFVRVDKVPTVRCIAVTEKRVTKLKRVRHFPPLVLTVDKARKEMNRLLDIADEVLLVDGEYEGRDNCEYHLYICLRTKRRAA